MSQPKHPKDAFAAGDFDAIGLFYYGIYDKLVDQGHAIVNIVWASTGWSAANPANLQMPAHDSSPVDMDEATRMGILVDGIDGCDSETSILLWLDPETGQPMQAQIAGPDADGDIAKGIIARDIGAEPTEPRKPSALQESLAKLTEELFPVKNVETFSRGDRVHSEKFGAGTVNLAVGNRTNVQFDTAGQQMVLAEFLSRLSKADNDNKKSALEFIDPSAWCGKPVPAREWYVAGMIPANNVTLLSGDGGTGKSLLALQVAAAGALGIDTLGLSPEPGKTLVLAAEDDEGELHRRVVDICNAHDSSLADLHGQMCLIPGAGKNVELMAINGPRGALGGTVMLEGLMEKIVSFQPAFTVLDTSADLFGGDEINRVQVRQFVGMLRSIALNCKTSILLLSHPSVAGMQTGTGLSGSTAWNNSVRSRLYLTSDKDDDDLRCLKGMKSNYGRKGDEIKLRWKEGAFVLDDGKPSAAAGIVNRHTDAKFRELLSAINRSGQRVAPTKGVNYAPSVMMMRPEAKGTSKKALEAAMHRLLSEGLIKVVMDGPPSKQRQKLIVSAEDLGPDSEPEVEAA